MGCQRMVFVVLHKSLCRVFLFAFLMLMTFATQGIAATCGPATSPGTAPPSWQTYCWIDMTSYNNATVMSTGQTFAITLSDGSIFNFTLTGTSSPTTTGLRTIVPPSWSGSAVGNTAFLGIPNKPILYTTAGGSVTLTMSGISITPPPGGTSSGLFKVVIADAESTNGGEALTYVTNGGAWTVIDQVDPISGSTYPTITNSGSTFTETGVGGTVGAYIVGTQSPTVVTATLQAGGLQGIMFAIQYATIAVNKTISGGRGNSTDQFTYSASSSVGTMSQNTSTGTGNGPFTAAVSTIATSVPVTVSEQMAGGSASTLAQYTSRLTCTNANTGSATALPSNVATTSHIIPSFQYGDSVSCTFTNTPLPATISVRKITVGGVAGPFSYTKTNLASNPPDITTTTAGVATPASPSAISVSAFGSPATIIESANAYFTLTSASCTDSNSALTGNSGSFGTLSGSTLTIASVNIEPGSQIICTLTSTANSPVLSLQKALAGTGRVAATDQFSLQATGTGSPSAVVTTGSGTSITSAAMTFTATAGNSYTFNETMAAGSSSALTLYLRTVACTNSNASGTNVSGLTSLPINVTPAAGDSIACIITNRPVIATLFIDKSASTAGPVNVGETIVYTYTVANTGNVSFTNVSVTDMHGTPPLQVGLGAGGIANETLTVAGPQGAGASTDSLANNGVWSTLAPGATVQFLYTHTVTQAEIDKG
jgi:hypothetical protein